MPNLPKLALLSVVAVGAVLVVFALFWSRGTALRPPPDDPDRARLVEKAADYSRYEQDMVAYATKAEVREPAELQPAPDEASSAADDDWKEFPRTSSFVKLVADRKATIQSEHLFRNRDLNPRDSYLSRADRAIIESVVARAKSDMAEISTISKAVAGEEFDILVKAGRTRTVAMADYTASLSEVDRKRHADQVAQLQASKREALEKQGVAPEAIEKILASSQPVAYKPNTLFGRGVYATRVVDGHILGATLDDLPKAKEAVSVGDQRLLQMASEIASIFVRRECLTQASADALIASIADVLFPAPKVGKTK